MATPVRELSFHAIRDAIVQTQKEMRAARRGATPGQRKAIDLNIRFLDKQQASLMRKCTSKSQQLDIV